ncbi:hypothetical protein PHMEG_0001487 [Phytophthora megakarya]|uniref:DDE Tnp4 domain-containing protein n=1 Tax=Phytophthora megakarya TaxID=4795 RepID=A0A225X0I2_9STRA|nr:hypothetical protein PHMEG_0001487 [Phytophthora megakarya]
MVDDATSKARYRFTIQQLRILAIKLQLPHDGIITSAGDRVGKVEDLAVVCRRLSEASTLLTVASEFGRSTAAYSRIVSATVRLLYVQHKDILYFHGFLIKTRIEDYCTTIHAASSPIQSCWGFIDGTKQYISRPSAREKSNIPNKNLQRSVFNGHMNWDKKQRVRQSTADLNLYVAILLFNCHTCLQPLPIPNGPLGNQISMYFGLMPPTLDPYLCAN